MIAELEIENFALVEKASFYFGSGLNVLTGETGAGKSLIVEALGFLLGASSKEKLLRAGAEKGLVCARFTDCSREAVDEAVKLGFAEAEDTELVISREMRAGRNVCRINGHMAAASAVKELGQILVDYNGQHQQYSLLRSSGHLQILDKFAGSEHLLKTENYAKSYRKMRSLEQDLERLRSGERERLREIDWTRHEIEEISAVAPAPGEDQELEAEIKILASAFELEQGSQKAHELLNGDNSILEKLSETVSVISSLENKDPRLAPIRSSLDEALAQLTDVSGELCSYADDVTSDPQRLEELQSRLEELRKLERKYGPGLEDVLAYAEKAAKHLEELQQSEERADNIEKELSDAEKERAELAAELTAAREEAARRLEEAVRGELEKVGMPLCRFAVERTAVPPSSAGEDHVEFVISPNPGEELRPLAKIASGGELSRIMLALLCLFSRYSRAGSIIFDEIDAGLGGRAADAVARRLADLSLRCQTVCVSHLAVIAAAGSVHYHLCKRIEDGRTVTEPELLEGEARVAEIARMLSGDASPDISRGHAKELLDSYSQISLTQS